MVKVFVSYAHEDTRYLERLLPHLANLRRQGRVEVWSDQEIPTGTEWKPEIWEHFKASEIVVLLVSADFINSDFCFGQEFKAALDGYRAGRKVVVPVIVRTCHLSGSSIASLQCLFVDKPVSEYEQENPDKPWAIVAGEIEKKVSLLESLPGAVANMPRERNEGDEVSHLCDRQLQEMAFMVRFQSQPPEVPQVYFLPGSDDAAHSGFVR